jgi:hypothetical protein
MEAEYKGDVGVFYIGPEIVTERNTLIVDRVNREQAE